MSRFDLLRIRDHVTAYIDALAARYDDPDFWNRAVIEAPDDSLA